MNNVHNYVLIFSLPMNNLISNAYRARVVFNIVSISYPCEYAINHSQWCKLRRYITANLCKNDNQANLLEISTFPTPATADNLDIRCKDKVQFTPHRYSQSSNNPLNYVLDYFTSPKHVFGSIYPLMRFVFFVSQYTSIILRSNFTRW